MSKFNLFILVCAMAVMFVIGKMTTHPKPVSVPTPYFTSDSTAVKNYIKQQLVQEMNPIKQMLWNIQHQMANAHNTETSWVSLPPEIIKIIDSMPKITGIQYDSRSKILEMQYQPIAGMPGVVPMRVFGVNPYHLNIKPNEKTHRVDAVWDRERLLRATLFFGPGIMKNRFTKPVLSDLFIGGGLDLKTKWNVDIPLSVNVKNDSNPLFWSAQARYNIDLIKLEMPCQRH